MTKLIEETGPTRNPPKSGRVYKGQMPEQRLERRRGQILDAALELFGTVGYHNTTILMICKEARVAKATFYEAFSGTDDVIAALYEDVYRVYYEKLSGLLAEMPADLEARLRLGIKTSCHALIDDPRKVQVCLIEAVGVSESLEERRRVQQEIWTDFLISQFQEITKRDGHTPGSAGYATSRLLAVGLIGFCENAMIDWLRDPDRPSADFLVDLLVDSFMTVIDMAGRRRSG